MSQDGQYYDDGHYYDVTVTHTDALVPFTPLGRASAHVRVSARPGDEVLCAGLLAFTDLHQRLGHASRNGSAPSPHLRLAEVIDRLEPSDLASGWCTTARFGEHMITVHAAPEAAGTQVGSRGNLGAETTLTWDTTGSPTLTTWCLSLHHPAEGTTARLAVTASTYAETITGFLAAFAAAFPRSDTRRHAPAARPDYDELLRFITMDLPDAPPAHLLTVMNQDHHAQVTR